MYARKTNFQSAPSFLFALTNIRRLFCFCVSIAAIQLAPALSLAQQVFMQTLPFVPALDVVVVDFTTNYPAGHVRAVSQGWPTHNTTVSYWKPNHLSSISTVNEDYPAPHVGNVSNSHNATSSAMWPPNHLDYVSLDWRPHLQDTSNAGPAHNEAVSMTWHPNHGLAASSTWVVPHGIVYSGAWPPGHALAQSSTGQPPLHQDVVSGLGHSENSSQQIPWPPNHINFISSTLPSPHQQSLSENYRPANHVHPVSLTWPNWPNGTPPGWPPNHIVAVSSQWGEIEPGE